MPTIPSITIQTATMQMEKEFMKVISEQDQLLAKGAQGIIDYFDGEVGQLYDFAYYLKRIIFKAFKEVSPYRDAQTVNEIPNDVYRQQIYNIIEDNVQIRDGIQIKNNGEIYDKKKIQRMIRESVFGNRTQISREKVFVLAFALNLDYSNVIELLQKGAGEKEFNFRNPYEVLLAYCFIDHTHMYEYYTELRQEFESRYNAEDAVNSQAKTLVFKQHFGKLKSEDDLIDFVCSLPNDESKSAKKEFLDLYDSLVGMYNNDSLSDTIEHQISSGEPEGYINLIALILRDNVVKDSDKKFNQITRELFGTTTIQKKQKNGEDVRFRFLKEKYAITAKDLQDIYMDVKPVHRAHLISLGFLVYVKDGSWEVAVKEYGNSNKDLANIFNDFSNYINPILYRAGYGDFCILNEFELLIMRCLYTINPIDSFKDVMILDTVKEDNEKH